MHVKHIQGADLILITDALIWYENRDISEVFASGLV